MMKIINHSEVLIKEIADLKKIKINFIPTMGNLHKGHESLILKAKESGFYNIVSVFVNPLQFNDENDYIRYPSYINQLLKCPRRDLHPRPLPYQL